MVIVKGSHKACNFSHQLHNSEADSNDLGFDLLSFSLENYKPSHMIYMARAAVKSIKGQVGTREADIK